MKFFLVALVALLLSACGPSKSELRAELSQIDAELMSLRIAANQHRSEMSQAEFDAFIGSFAAGYGAVSGDYGLASDGVGTAVNSSRQYDASSYSLKQIRERTNLLIARRAAVVSDLN